MNTDTSILLLAITLAAVVSPAVGRRLGIPAALIEITCGIGLGLTGWADAGSGPFVRFLADLGFALFLFLAGMEVDVAALRQRGPLGVLGPALSAVVAFLLAAVGCLLFGRSPWLALAIGSTSVPLLLSVVRESGALHTPEGRHMVNLAAVGEVVTVGLVALAEVLHEGHGVFGTVVGVARLLGFLALVVLGTRLLAVLRWWFPRRVDALVAGGDPAENAVRAGFGLTFAMIGAAAAAGVEPLLGAFVGGLMVAFTLDEKTSLEHKFAPVAYGFLIPVFFVDVGIRLDLPSLLVPANAPTILSLVGLMFVSKLLPNLAGLLVGRSLRSVLVASLLLASPLTMVIAVADLCVRLGVIDAGTESVLVAAGMSASLVLPLLARRLSLRAPGPSP